MLPTLPLLKPGRKLATLSRLPRAGKLRFARGVQNPAPPLSPATNEIVAEPFEQKYAKYGVFDSSFERYIWEWLNKTGYQKAHQWRLQVNFGHVSRLMGNWTRVDFLSDILQIAWFPDGTYYHAGDVKKEHDILLRAQVGAAGYRVVQWLIPDSDYLVRNLPDFYRRMLRGEV